MSKNGSDATVVGGLDDEDVEEGDGDDVAGDMSLPGLKV